MKAFCIRLSRLDIADRNALGCAPVDEGVRRELGPIVDAYPGGPAVQPNEVIKDPDHAGARNRRADLDREGLPIALVEHVERPEAAAVVEGIGMKSRAQISLSRVGATRGWRRRTGIRRFVRRGRFSRRAQYTRCTRLWFHGCPARRSR